MNTEIAIHNTDPARPVPAIPSFDLMRRVGDGLVDRAELMSLLSGTRIADERPAVIAEVRTSSI